MRDFRIGVGTPRYDERARFRAAEKQRVADRDTRLLVGNVGELVGRGDIADRVDVRIGGLQVVVDLDAGGAIVLDARGFEVEIFDIGRASGADQYFIRRNFLDARLARGNQDFLRTALLDA